MEVFHVGVGGVHGELEWGCGWLEGEGKSVLVEKGEYMCMKSSGARSEITMGKHHCPWIYIGLMTFFSQN